MTSVRFPEDIAYRLNALVAHTHRTKSFYIIDAMNKYLEELEDSYDLQLALKRSADPARKFYTHDELLRKLKLGDHV